MENNDTPGPTPEELKRELRAQQVISVDIQSSEPPISSIREKIELDERLQFLELRSKWSTWLILWITFQLVLQAEIAIFVGIKYFDFRDYQWLVTIIIGQTFLQIVGMGYVIVNFLYPKTGSANAASTPSSPG